MKKKRRYGKSLKEQLQASLNDRLYNFLLAGDTVRGVIVNGTRMVNEMRWNHELGVLETLVLGHAYLAAALMSAGLKGNDRLGLQVDCSGPIKGLSVEANAYGEVRGYLKQVPIPVAAPLESFNPAPFFGAGFLSVTKHLEDSRHPFRGNVMMEHGTLAKDLAVYFQRSEQIRTAMALSVAFDGDGEVEGAGGMFIQALPGAEETVLADLEAELNHLPSLARTVHAPDFPLSTLNECLGRFGPRIIDHRGIEFMCHCSRKRIATMLNLLAIEDLADMAANGPFPVEIRCHNCNSQYTFTQKQLQTIYGQRFSRS
jgi:molecular chaperone Hsp33